ncbi:hypothetical protein VdG2_08660 [Verticillium dahliae VDG2]|nr:hypothetical protein VdG2_08660 [Verticillium dahliae VDG2]
MSLRIVPASAASQTFTATSTSTSAPSVPGLHDTLRTGLGPSPLSSASNALAADPATTLTISWEDVYPGDEGMGSAGGVGMHDEMERKLKM